jgi:hypothetical protein
MANETKQKASDLDAQLAHIAAMQTKLSAIQEEIVQTVSATGIHTSPAILLAKMLAGYSALLCVGVAIGVLL